MSEIDAARANVERIDRRGSILLDHPLRPGGHHEGGLDLAGCPVWMQGLEQGARSGNVRAGHRGAADGLEVLPGRSAAADDGKSQVGSLAGQDVDTRSSDVRLADTQCLSRATARAEGGHDVTLDKDLHATRQAAGHTGVGSQPVEQDRTRFVVDVHRRNEVVVRVQGLDGRVVQDHPTSTRGLDVGTLFHTGHNSALADYDLIGGEGSRWEGIHSVGGTAQGIAIVSAQHDLSADAATDGHTDQVEHISIIGGEVHIALERAGLGAGSGRRRPGLAVTNGVGARTGVAGGARYEHAVLKSAQEREGYGIGVGIAAAADGKVDRIHPIEDGLLYRGRRVTGVATASRSTADPVHDDMGPGGDA